MIKKLRGAKREAPIYLLVFCITVFAGCSTQHQLHRAAKRLLFANPVIASGHTGISIYEPATKKYWYGYNDSSFFVPASNTKLFTLYAAMKLLGDSFPGLKYNVAEDGSIYLYPTGDPTFLHPDFTKHPVYDFLAVIPSQQRVFVITNDWKAKPLGSGWAWNDYSDYYMAERSAWPMYGNVQRFYYDKDSLTGKPIKNFDIKLSNDVKQGTLPQHFTIKRLQHQNSFEVLPSAEKFVADEIPLIQGNALLNDLLKDTLANFKQSGLEFISSYHKPASLQTIYSQPLDSLLKPLMHRSDNFYAEQTLLMVSNKKLGYMDDAAIMDTLLKDELHDIPQKPQWADGSGLSRYNLFTPKDFIYILEKLKNEFGLDRLQGILPTGGTGTLRRYFNSDSGYIFAKTGTLSNQVALSGYLITRKNKLLLFSILNNNYQGSTAAVRRSVESLLQYIREKY